MQIDDFINLLDCDFFTGVPDSLLKPLYDCLIHKYGLDPRHHIIAANEGNCVALAAGYYLATGKVPVVYLQNSGEGNIINPLASLLSRDVYGIPAVFIIGWRGEPGLHDEPQHTFQGKVTLRLLEDMDVAYAVIGKETKEDEMRVAMDGFRDRLSAGQSVAFVVQKGAMSYDERVVYANRHSLKREEIIRAIVSVSDDDPIVCTTGKASRELFEIREERGEGHGRDFLTVGSMGHSSSIALGIAIQHPEQRIWCIDGDGAAIMHMGAMAVIGNVKPRNLVHIVINNESHESVGGAPTVANTLDFILLARACGYEYSACVDKMEGLKNFLQEIVAIDGLSFLEVKCGISSRSDLERPTIRPRENKARFMKKLWKNFQCC